MDTAFVPSSFAISSSFMGRRVTCCERRAVATVRMSASSQGWSPARFLRTVLWYGPLGRLVGRPAAAVAAVQPPSTSSDTSVSRAVSGERAGRTVLVTGAAGGVGRRVVAALLADGVRVRAMARSRDGVMKALRDAGVSEYTLGDEQSLEIVLADLYNLREELFDGVDGIIGCTGTRIGPPGDTPDRAMYYQGIKFYTPTVLDDTPENVEYNGVRELMKMARKALVKRGAQPVYNFDDATAVAATWGPLDDVVMGGASSSSVSADNGELCFKGRVTSANNGGFASTRTVDSDLPLDLSAYDGVELRVRGDGRRFKLILRDERKWDGVGHSVSFDTTADTYVTVRVPWSEFRAVMRGRDVPNRTIDPSQIVAAQLMLSRFEYDGTLNPTYSDGDFELRVASFGVYTASSPPTLPSPFVHCSSCGVTRVLRRAEFKEEELPPAVRLNEQVGRVVEWKLAAEDAIRTNLAHVGYTIVRPTALTIDEPLGMDALRLAQGDNIRGQVTRDDIARFMVDALFDERLKNTTVEVAQVQGEEKEEKGKLEEQLATLERDSDAKTRTFGPFPFVPQ